MNKEQIDRLTYKPGRENIWPYFHALSSEEQLFLQKAGKENCVMLNVRGRVSAPDTTYGEEFENIARYLLKPDYVPERETKKVDIFFSNGCWRFTDPSMDIPFPMTQAMACRNAKEFLWPNGDTARYLKWEVTDQVKVVFWKE